MEYLSIQIFQATATGNWRPFTIENKGPKISHLLFVDDVLLSAKADNALIQTLKNIIKDFCEVSDMDINLEKSKLWTSPFITEDRKNDFSKFKLPPD